MRTRLLNMAWSNLSFNVWRSFVTMATNLPSCFSIQFLEEFLKFLVNFTLLKYVKSQRNYSFLITKELIFGFQILDLKDHFSASLTRLSLVWYWVYIDCKPSIASLAEGTKSDSVGWADTICVNSELVDTLKWSP